MAPGKMTSVQHLLTEVWTEACRRGRSGLCWLILGLIGIFFLACHLALPLSPGGGMQLLAWKKGIVLSGVLGAVLFLVAAAVRRGDYREIGPLRSWLCFFPIAIALWALLGHWDLVSLGTLYAQMTSDFWGATVSPEHHAVLKRVGLPALARLLGFQADTYIYGWFFLYAVGLRLACGYLLDAGLSFLETLSTLTSSLFACWLIAPGYSELLVFILAFQYLRRSIGMLEKLILVAFALSIHEAAGAVVFLTVALCGREEDRAPWLLAWLAVLGIYALAAWVTSHWSAGSEPDLFLTLRWLRRDPVTALVGILAAYKLYGIIPLLALARGPGRMEAVAAFLGLPLIFLGLDTSRIVQFGSLGLMLVIPLVVVNWSRTARFALALANLLVPSIYIGLATWPTLSDGLYRLYLKLLPGMG